MPDLETAETDTGDLTPTESPILKDVRGSLEGYRPPQDEEVKGDKLVWEDEYDFLPEEVSRIPGQVRDKSYSFAEKVSAAFSSFNSVSQFGDILDERNAKRFGENGIEREELLRDVPPQFHEEVLGAAEEHNDDTALTVRNNILQDVADNKVFDSMPWYAQIGYGAPAAVLDPLALVPAIGIGKVGIQATRTARAWQTHGAFKNLAIGSTWFAAGATETALQAAPKLAADYTYNASDYILDTVAGGLIGSGLGLGFEHRGIVTQYFPNREADKARIDEIAERADVYDVELSNLDDLTPAQRWEETVNSREVDLLKEGTYPLSIEGEIKLQGLEKEAKKSYGRILEGKKFDEVDEYTQELARGAFRALEDAKKDPSNFVLPNKPDESLSSPRDVEIERRLNVKRLKEEYAERLHTSNDKLQKELHDHILNKESLDATEPTDYTSRPVTEDTPNTATLATEIRDGQPVLVEVEGDTPKEVEYPNMSQDISGDIDKHIKAFGESGELEANQLAEKSNNLLQSTVRGLNKVLGMTDMNSRFVNSGNKHLQYVASRITETAQGFGGKMTRKPSAALTRDSKFRAAENELVVAYRDAETAYAKEQGGGAITQMRARNEAGVDNPLVDKFNREFIKLQELRRQGKSVDDISQAVKDFAEGWNKSMDISFNHLVDGRVAGFSKARKIDNYYTQSWLQEKLVRARKNHGSQKVRDVLALGYRTAAGAKDDITDAQSNEMADALLAFIETKNSRAQMADDEFVSTAAQDARSKARLSINTIAEIDGLSVMDLLDTDVMGVGSRYNNRAAGWSSLSEATDGLLNSDKAIQKFKDKIQEEGTDKRLLKYYEDTIEMMLGKPVRGGLSPALRELKDLAALSQLGGKGIAQLAETGQVVTRSLLKAFNDKENLKRLLRDAGHKGTVEELSTEAQRLSNMTADMEWLERQSTHTDTAESIGKVKYMLHTAAGKLTGGNRVKANAGRLLGKVSGFNMIRRAQTRITHASLMREIADNLVNGKSAITTERLTDLGVLDQKGKNPALARIIRTHGTFEDDGTLSKMNFEQWPKKQQDEVKYALLRDDAQSIQRTMIGELPGWMNSPLMSLIMQYKEMPMVAMNKSLGRATAFADREAVVGVVLSTMTAGIAMSGRKVTVAGSDATLGDGEYRSADLDTVDTMKYVNFAGMYPDLYDLVMNDGTDAVQAGTSKAAAEFATRQIPTLGLMKAYKDTVSSENAEQLIENSQSLLPLGNTMLGEAMTTFILEKM